MDRIKTSLELRDEISLHKTGWKIQRTGWIIILLLLIVSSLGFFGNGLLSKTVISDSINKITFEKQARYQAPMQMIIHAKSHENRIEVQIPQSYLESFELDKIVPEPQQQKLSKALTIFTFETENPTTIKFYLIPEKTGQVKAQIRVNESDFIITHFIYP